MKILALDTSTAVASVAVLEDEESMCEITTGLQKSHSEMLISIVDHALAMAGLELKDINLVAVGRGPGSFTGIRIGIATAEGMARAINSPVVGVCTLDALAYNACPQEIQIIPVMDARKREVFCSIYSPKGEQLSPYYNLRPEDIRHICSKDSLFIGDGLMPYSAVLENSLGKLFHKGPRALWFPRAYTIGLLAMEGRIDGQGPVQPIYVRASDATILLKDKGRNK